MSKEEVGKAATFFCLILFFAKLQIIPQMMTALKQIMNKAVLEPRVLPAFAITYF